MTLVVYSSIRLVIDCVKHNLSLSGWIAIQSVYTVHPRSSKSREDHIPDLHLQTVFKVPVYTDTKCTLQVGPLQRL